MVYEDIDAGDDAGRYGDHISFPHKDSDGTALDSVSLEQGAVVWYDESNDQLEYSDGTDSQPPAGVLQNYDVYGDTGQEKISGDTATVVSRGHVKADLTENGGVALTDEGTFFDADNVIYIVEVLDANNNLARVLVR